MDSDYYYSHFSFLPSASVYPIPIVPFFTFMSFYFVMLGFTRAIHVIMGVELSTEAWWAH